MSTDAAPTFGPMRDDITYDGNDIQHDALDDVLNNTEFTADETPLDDVDDSDAIDEFLRSEQPQFDEPDPSLIQPQRRPAHARKYERKVAGLFSLGVKVTATQPKMLADSAAMLMYGPDISEKMGNLAVHDPRVARMIDMVTDQTENPYAAVFVATAPFVMQVLRNHEPVIEKQRDKPPRMLRIPFTKRAIRLRLGFKMGKRMKSMTQDPKALQRHVFTNPAILETLRKQGIVVPTE